MVEIYIPAVGLSFFQSTQENDDTAIVWIEMDSQLKSLQPAIVDVNGEVDKVTEK